MMLSHLLGQGGHKSAHLCPSKVICWSTSQEDRSPPVVCLGRLSPKTYFLDSRLLSPVVEGKRLLCFEVVFYIGCTGSCLCLWEVLLTQAGKKNSLPSVVVSHRDVQRYDFVKKILS